MIRKIKKEATKASFFKDPSTSKFDEVTKNLRKFKSSMKEIIPSNRKSFFIDKNSTFSNFTSNKGKINSIKSTSRTGMGSGNKRKNQKSTSKLNEDFKKKYGTCKNSNTKKKKDNIHSFRNTKYFNKKLEHI